MLGRIVGAAETHMCAGRGQDIATTQQPPHRYLPLLHALPYYTHSRRAHRTFVTAKMGGGGPNSEINLFVIDFSKVGGGGVWLQ